MCINGGPSACTDIITSELAIFRVILLVAGEGGGVQLFTQPTYQKLQQLDQVTKACLACIVVFFFFLSFFK